MYILAVCCDHSHLQAGNTHIEKAHGRTVDETQTHLLTLAEKASPAICRCLPVHQVGVGITAYVGQIALAHAHLHPHLALGPGACQALFLEIPHQVFVGALIEIVVVAELLQLGIDHRGVFIGPVRQHDHVVTVIGERFRLDGIHDDGTVQPGLLLKAGMAVIPVGSALHQLEAVFMSGSRCDARKTVGYVGYTVHAAGQYDAMPVYGTAFGQVVLHPQGDSVAFLPAQDRRRQ